MTSGLATMASTLLSRLAQRNDGEGLHAVRVGRSGERWELEVGTTSDAPPLCTLCTDEQQNITLTTWAGESQRWEKNQLAEVSPDPLWASVEGICQHMEDDHQDTFALFLRMAGRPDLADCESITMPWVQADGFFLTAGAEHVWVAFPQRCVDPNSVRTTLILMLRGARAAHRTH